MRCVTCHKTTRAERKYCSRTCAPYGHFLSGKRLKGPIEYFSRARLEIERLEEENAQLRAQIEGLRHEPEPDLSPHPMKAIAEKGKTVWVARRPRFETQHESEKSLEERALELLRELHGPGYGTPK